MTLVLSLMMGRVMKTGMGYSLQSLKGVECGIIYGSVIGVIKGDTRSLDWAFASRFFHVSMQFLWQLPWLFSLNPKPPEP